MTNGATTRILLEELNKLALPAPITQVHPSGLYKDAVISRSVLLITRRVEPLAMVRCGRAAVCSSTSL